MRGTLRGGCDLAGEPSFDGAAIGLILTAHWLLFHARQPWTQQAALPCLVSPALPLAPSLFSLLSLIFKCNHLIAWPKQDGNDCQKEEK